MGESAVRKIIHIDMDAFYASVEQRDAPELRGKPVAVGHGGPRGVVAAASYEARLFGVRSAMPSTTARRRCPDLCFVAPRFDVYRSVSDQIRRIFAGYTGLIEPLSLDEAYLDVTESLRGGETASALASEIRARIRTETGLSASAGISYNKFLAKLASDHNKPDGQFTVPPARGEAFVAGLAVGRFHGVGAVTTDRMQRLGLATGADLRRCSLAFLVAHFGKSGAWYHALARAEDHRAVIPDRPRKSSGSETTFSRDLTAPAEIEAGVVAMADEVWAGCANSAVYGRTVTVKIKYADFEQITRRRTMSLPIASADGLRDTSIELVRSAYPIRMGVRLLGVAVSGFEPRAVSPARQLSFSLDGHLHR